MSSLKSLASYAGFLGLLTLSGCLDSGSGKAQAPVRPIDISRTIVTAANPTNAEVAAGQSISVRLADKRGAGIAGVQPRITLVDGSGSVPAGVTGGSCSTSSATGVATCTVSASAPGNYYVKLVSPSSHVTTTGVTFVQKLYSLQFTTQPTCVGCVVGSAFSTTVRVLDRAGSPITTGPDSVVNVVLSINSGGGNLLGTLNLNTSGGSVTFPGLSVTKAAALTLKAVGAGGAAIGISNSFTPVPGAPDHVKFTTQPPAKVASNIEFNPAPVVGLFDSFDNAIKSTNCTISITRSGVAGTLLGSSVKVTNAGVADFAGSGLRYNTTNADTGYRLRATPSGANCATGVAAADSNYFEVTLSGVPNQMALITPPGTAAISQIWPVPPRIQILDIDGKPVTDDSKTVVTMALISYQSNVSGAVMGKLVGQTSVQALNGVVAFSNMFISPPTAGSDPEKSEGSYEYRFTAVSPGITFAQPLYALQTITADGNRAPFRLQFMDQPESGSIGQILAPMRVSKVDANGYLNFTDNTTEVDLNLVGTGGFDLAGATSRTARLVNGIATFSGLKVVKPTASSDDPTGVKNFTTNFKGEPDKWSSSNFAISAFGAPAQLRFVGAINDNASTGSTPWNNFPVVYIQDSANNTVANDSTTKVTVKIAQYTNAGGEPTLMSALTRQAVGGKVEFDGMYTSETNVTNIVLAATSDTGLTPAQSVTFNGNRSVPTLLRFVKAPVAGYKSDTAGSCQVTGTSGQNDPISIELVDAGGQRVTADNTTKILLTCTGCTISAGSEATVQSGVATFGSLRTDQSRTGVVLRATSGSLPFLDSSSFNIPVCNP